MEREFLCHVRLSTAAVNRLDSGGVGEIESRSAKSPARLRGPLTACTYRRTMPTVLGLSEENLKKTQSDADRAKEEKMQALIDKTENLSHLLSQ